MTKFIWQNGIIKPFDEATTHVMSHGLHYGTGVFEGIRAYKLSNGHTGILCLDEHLERFFDSGTPIGLNIPYTKDQLKQAILAIIKKNEFSSCYIRPLAYFGRPPTSGIRVTPADDTPTEVIIACYELGNYLPDQALDVKISDFIRIHPKSTAVDAKICGHYVNSVQALSGIKNTKYGEVILLDYEGYVAEGSSENIFLVKDKVIYTPEKGTILKGITRQIIINLIKSLGYTLSEAKIKADDLYTADEVFFSGTAVEIRGVATINDQRIGHGGEGEITKLIKAEYQKICHGDNSAYSTLLTVVK